MARRRHLPHSLTATHRPADVRGNLTVGCFTAAALQAAVPARGRRSKPSPRFFSVGDTRSRCAAHSGAALKSGVPGRPRASRRSRSRQLYALCGPAGRGADREVGAPPGGGRRSRPSSCFCAVGSTRSRCATRSGAALKSGVPGPSPRFATSAIRTLAALRRAALPPSTRFCVARFRGALQNRKSRVNLMMNDCAFNSGYPGTSVSRSEL